MDKLYCCYSLNLRNYLFDNGLRYELAAKNPNSNQLFWVYIKNKKIPGQYPGIIIYLIFYQNLNPLPLRFESGQL